MNTIDGHPRPATLAEIRAAYRREKMPEEWDGNWVMVLLYRPLSHPLAWACLRAGIGANPVTVAAMALSLALPLAAVLVPAPSAGAAVCLLGAACILLDCVDGTVARMSASESRFGAELDFIADMTYWGLLYASIGIVADRMLGTGGGWTAAALAAAWLRLLARLVRDAEAAARGPRPPAGGPKHPVARFLDGLSGAIPFLALAGGWLPAAIGFLVLYSAADLAQALRGFLRGARA